MHFKAYDGKAFFDGSMVSFRWSRTAASSAKWRAGDQSFQVAELSGVEDADATAAKASELGGSTVAEVMDIPTVGRIALIKDPQGAVFGIIKPEPAS